MSDLSEEQVQVLVSDAFLGEMRQTGNPFFQRAYRSDAWLIEHLSVKFQNMLINTWRNDLADYSLEAALVKLFTWCLKRYYTPSELNRPEERAAMLSVLLLEKLDAQTRPTTH